MNGQNGQRHQQKVEQSGHPTFVVEHSLQLLPRSHQKQSAADGQNVAQRVQDDEFLESKDGNERQS